MTKVYLKPRPGLSRAMDRVAHNLGRFIPANFTLTEKLDEAEIVFLHVIGYNETLEQVNAIKERGQQYVVLQYCVRTTENPHTAGWLDIWKDAVAVYSYYDLTALMDEDGVAWKDDSGPLLNFFWATLGADPSIWKPSPIVARRRLALATGYVAESETLDVIAEAVHQVGRALVHIGPKLNLVGDVRSIEGIADDALCANYQRVQYVFGLRKIEGFELPCIEGLFCGARPVVYDTPHYRMCYGDFAEYIRPGDNAEVLVQLLELFNAEYRAVTAQEIEAAHELYNWQHFATNLWSMIARQMRPAPRVQVTGGKRKLLWIGDAVVSTGFAKSTHYILETLRHHYDVMVLGLNYEGDPHPYPYPIYPCIANYGDGFGLKRIPKLVSKLAPDLIVVQNDPWNFPKYLKVIGSTPTVGVVAVDGLNCRGRDLNGLKLAIFWTQFGAREAANGGYQGRSVVIPLGVDLNVFTPGDRDGARRLLFPKPAHYERVKDAFIVLNVNRNQPRKRMDLTVQYFAEWVKNYQVHDAMLFLHVAPTGEDAYDVEQLMEYYGLSSRLIWVNAPLGSGVSESELVLTYRASNLQVSTSQGEGFGLTTLEGMACGIPQLHGRWSALAELFDGIAAQANCPTTIATPNKINAIGGVPDKAEFIEHLNTIYRNEGLQHAMKNIGYTFATQDRFNWNLIGQQFVNVLKEVV